MTKLLCNTMLNKVNVQRKFKIPNLNADIPYGNEGNMVRGNMTEKTKTNADTNTICKKAIS